MIEGMSYIKIDSFLLFICQILLGIYIYFFGLVAVERKVLLYVVSIVRTIKKSRGI